MKIYYNLLIVFTTLFFSCSTNDESEFVGSLWVDSERISCTGVGEQTCYRIQESTVIDENAWSLFYDNIEGFDEQYQVGYIYKLSIIKKTIDNPPADASSVIYILNKIISKKLDK